ncbi:DUF5723 family protein [Roseivirga misakiensis]|nr:DUF5723 family protein [Roseivirga misakiensis]
MKKLAIITLFLISALNVNAQGYLSFYQLRDIVPQTAGLQPAFIPNNSITVSMPALNNGVMLQGDLKLQELLSRPDGQSELTLDFDLMNSVAQDLNYLNLDVTSNLFHVGVKTKKGGYSFFANARATMDFVYSKDFIDFVANGNGNKIGQTIDFSETRLRIEAYHEIGVGYARKFLGERLTVGARAKLVTGIFHGSLKDGASASLTTQANDFSWQIAVQNGTANTAGLDFLFNSDDYESNALTDYITANDNQTIAFDFGAKFKALKWLEVEASITDLGSINWKEQVRNYNTADTVATFSGVQLEGLEDSGEVFKDSLENNFRSNETRLGFKTNLPTRMYLTASAYLTPNDRFSLTYFHNNALDNFPANYALAYNHKFDKFVVGLLGTYRGSNNEMNIGANLGTNIGPVQLYLAMDNVLVTNGPEQYSKADFRFGLNLMFGYKKWIKKDSVADLDAL